MKKSRPMQNITINIFEVEVKKYKCPGYPVVDSITGPEMEFTTNRKHGGIKIKNDGKNIKN